MLSDWQKKIKDFTHRRIQEGARTRLGAWALRQAQLVVLVFREFIADSCLLRASALTYTTLLSIVPLLALAFSLLKGLGVQNTLQPFILEKLAVGSEQVVQEIIQYINNTNVGRLGMFGLITLLVTVLTLLSNIEQSFNHIWGVGETRTIFRRFADYFSVLIFGPIFLTAAISMTSTVESQWFVQALMEMAYVGQVIIFLFQVLPYFVMWAAFTFLYIFMPNVKVRFPAALIGGIIGGTLWQLAQWTYVSFQIGVSRYNAIYGTMAALPILMVWIYISWLIVLLGAEIAYTWQNLHAIRREIREEKVNFATQEMVALTIMVAVSRVFYEGSEPRSMEKLSEELQLPPRLTRLLVNELMSLGYLSELVGGEQEERYQPARAPEKVSVYQFLEAFRKNGRSLENQERIFEWKKVLEVERRLAEVERRELEGMTLRDMAVEKS